MRATPRSSTRSRAAVESVLADVHAVVDDWSAMRDRALELAADLRATPPPTADARRRHRGGDVPRVARRRPLHVRRRLRRGGRRSARHGSPALPSGLSRSRTSEPAVLTLTKALERSTVHRAVPLDFVGVQTLRRRRRGRRRATLLRALHRHRLQRAARARCPCVRRKAAAVIARSGYPPLSHGRRTLVNVLETIPRDELFRLLDRSSRRARARRRCASASGAGSGCS